jgi:hypothetical protein
VERSVDGDRLAGLRVVVQGLPEGDAEQEDEEYDERAQAPPDQFPTPLLAAALVALDRRQGRHGL